MSSSITARFRTALPIIAVVFFGTGVSAHAGLITINPTFDSTVTSGEESAIDAAIGVIESDITSPNSLTVSIYFNTMNSGLGSSLTGIYAPSYLQYYDAYAAVATSPAQLEALASLGPAPTGPLSGNPVNGNATVDITSAEGRNLGFDTPGVVTVKGNSGTFDSEIEFNSGITSPPEGLAGNYSLESVVMHEMDEALGIGGTGSTLGGDPLGPVGDLDLYRYSAPGARSYSTSASSPYFSIDGGTTVVSYFNQVAGADYADWASDPIPNGFGPQVQDAFGTPGSSPVLGPSELTAFSAIGYDLTTPEPSTLALAGLGMIACLLIRRKRAAKV